jgi:4-hydroxy-2-oxoheptanedioate aldolase
MNLLKERIKSGKAGVNGWLAVPSGFTAEVMAQAGWHSLTVDLQHGVQDYLSMVACFQGFQHKPVTPMVRVPWNEPGIIGKVLDAGAYGVICPMIESREDTEAFVRACRYPPAGRRSNGPIRAAVYGAASGYQATANDEILCLPMIETRSAVEQLDAILDVPGIDGVYIGPSDLSWALGYQPALDREEPEILALYQRILDGTARRGLFAALHCATPGYAAKAIGMGFRLVTIMNDSGLMLSAARAVVSQVRSEAGALAAD